MDFLWTPRGIIIHHSATRDTDTISFDAIAEYHVGENGWDETGYQFVCPGINFPPVTDLRRWVFYGR